MTIHDDAIVAFRTVYDEALVSKDRALEALQVQHSLTVRDLERAVTDLEAVRTQLSESSTLVETLSARVATREAEIATLNSQLSARDAEIVTLRQRIADLEAGQTPTDPTASRMPKDYNTLAELIADQGLPTNANYVTWTPADGDDIVAWSKRLPSDAVMVFPKDKKGMQFDSSKGFKASDTISMEYISDADYLTKGANPKPYSERYVTGMTDVDPSPGFWFSMLRVPRGIVALSKDFVLEPTDSGYKGQRQPKGQMNVIDRRDTQVPKRLFPHVGVQQKLIETVHASPIFANFTLRSRDFGTIAYSGLAAGKAGGTTTISNVHLDKCWHGFAGIPNGEAGGIAIGGKFSIKNVTFSTDEAYSSSPIMWNRSEGGDMENVWIGKHRIGMITFWKSGGVNNFKDVVTNAGTVGINLEEDLDSFVLNWDGGAMITDAASNMKHLNIWPSQGSIEVHMTGVDVRDSAGNTALIAHSYGTASKQKKSDITRDNGAISYIPGNSTLWV